jgi:Na+/H+ antiporter NhaD/arsenite permease-like protein
VLFPFHVPIYLPRSLCNAVLDSLSAARVISRRREPTHRHHGILENFIRFEFPFNFITTPLLADLFLLAISAIDGNVVHDGTIGVDGISPLDIMAFFLTLAYIAISIDASGLIRYLAFKVLKKKGSVGHGLFLYLYAFFFGLASFIGNDPIILSGTAFIAYMTRVSSNIAHPKAWIHTQFAVANIASAILVSSNPTNLVLAGAFNIKFIEYTANMIVPVLFTAIILFPFLLYIVFADQTLIPFRIEMHTLSEEAKAKKPVNPNIPYARINAEGPQGLGSNDDKSFLEEVMNPFVDKSGAMIGGIIMTTTLVTVLVLNATAPSKGGYPVFWVALPTAFVMLCWDLGYGWRHRHETREIARQGREKIQLALANRALRQKERERQKGKQAEAGQERRATPSASQPTSAQNQFWEAQTLTQRCSSATNAGIDTHEGVELETYSAYTESAVPGILLNPTHIAPSAIRRDVTLASEPLPEASVSTLGPSDDHSRDGQPMDGTVITGGENNKPAIERDFNQPQESGAAAPGNQIEDIDAAAKKTKCSSEHNLHQYDLQRKPKPTTLVSLVASAHRWLQETFPTATTVMAQLPFTLVPFALCMFVLVQALVSKGWIEVFAYGWDHWVSKTGTVGSIGGMGFLSVLLCNVGLCSTSTSKVRHRKPANTSRLTSSRVPTLVPPSFFPA